MALGDVYKLALRSKINNQDLLNVFWYESVEASADAQAIAESFAQQVLPAIRDATTEAVNYTEIFCENVEDSTDWSSKTLLLTGNIAQTTAPAFVAGSIALRPQNRDIGVGGKRFGGMGENYVGSGGMDPALEALLIAVAQAILAVLVDVATQLIDYAIPVLVKRATLPPATGPIERSQIVSYLPPKVGSQVSRKG
jgi:hypothetical protein